MLEFEADLFSEANSLLRCLASDAKSLLYQDASPVLADAAVKSTISQGRTAFMSPCPSASWDTPAFRGRCAFIRTLKDRVIPYDFQNAILQSTEQEWIVRDIGAGHSVQLVAPEELCRLVVELAMQFEAL